MVTLPRLLTGPTVGTPLPAHLEEPAREAASAPSSAAHDIAVSHVKEGRAQHGAPRHFSFRPDSAGGDRHMGFHKNMAPIVAENAKLKMQVAELTNRCETLLAANAAYKRANGAMEVIKEENARLKLKILELEGSLRKVAEGLELPTARKV